MSHLSTKPFQFAIGFNSLIFCWWVFWGLFLGKAPLPLTIACLFISALGVYIPLRVARRLKIPLRNTISYKDDVDD